MRRRTRKFVGSIALLALVMIYAPIAMALAQARPLQELPGLAQALAYACLGLFWVLPALPLVRWMETPDRE